jgi:putative molybdopterin biosynthesis protein
LARGAGAAMSLVRADGFCVIEQNSEGIEAGQTARIELFRPLHDVTRTLVSTGSHDLILDLIADMMSGNDFFLAGTHVGSMAGLMALKRGECHIAPIHLLDEDSGEYNIPYLKRMFPNTPLCLIKGVGRTQGLIVKKGNPLGLHSIEQLVVKKLTDNQQIIKQQAVKQQTSCHYINRQRGSGTRLFFDFLLKQAGINGENIQGYNREAVTHLAVAAAVKNGDADAGMGITSAAAALDLDFIPLGNEDYDFVMFSHTLDIPQFKTFHDILKSDSFHKHLEEIGGYTYEHCGEIKTLNF